MAKKRKLNSKNPKYLSASESKGPESTRVLMTEFTPKGQTKGKCTAHAVFLK